MYKKKGWITWEILLGVVLILVLIGVFSPKGVGVINGGKEARASSDTAVLGATISEYNVEIGAYPASLNDLTKKNGQYGPWIPKITDDPWGRPYRYVKNDDGFAVYSFGSDGRDNGSSVGGIAHGDVGFSGK